MLGHYADPGHGDRDRAAQVRPAARVLQERRWRRRRRMPRRGARRGPRGPQRPARAAVRHHRRRDRAGTSTTRCTAEREGEGLSAVGGDRRRQPLRAPRRRARPRSARARHLGLFPAPRDPDAAGEALQRACARSTRTSIASRMVCEMAITPTGEVARYEFYPAVFRSHARLTYTEVWARRSPRGKRAGRPADALRGCSRCCRERARSAARSTSRPSRRA